MDKINHILSLYPVTIISDRYCGCYSGGKYTAWNLSEETIPQGASSSDVPCAEFWDSNEIVCGLGQTPNKALYDLYKKLSSPVHPEKKEK